MTKEEAKIAFAQLKEQGETDEDILGVLYLMFIDDKFDLEELSEMVEALGYELSPEFLAMSPEDQKTKGWADDEDEIATKKIEGVLIEDDEGYERFKLITCIEEDDDKKTMKGIVEIHNDYYRVIVDKNGNAKADVYSDLGLDGLWESKYNFTPTKKEIARFTRYQDEVIKATIEWINDESNYYLLECMGENKKTKKTEMIVRRKHFNSVPGPSYFRVTERKNGSFKVEILGRSLIKLWEEDELRKQTKDEQAHFNEIKERLLEIIELEAMKERLY